MTSVQLFHCSRAQEAVEPELEESADVCMPQELVSALTGVQGWCSCRREHVRAFKEVQCGIPWRLWWHSCGPAAGGAGSAAEQVRVSREPVRAFRDVQYDLPWMLWRRSCGMAAAAQGVLQSGRGCRREPVPAFRDVQCGLPWRLWRSSRGTAAVGCGRAGAPRRRPGRSLLDGWFDRCFLMSGFLIVGGFVWIDFSSEGKKLGTNRSWGCPLRQTRKDCGALDLLVRWPRWVGSDPLGLLLVVVMTHVVSRHPAPPRIAHPAGLP
jgi:hypothetical protein